MTRRSSAAPTTPAGKALSAAHLRETIALSADHARDHRAAAKKGDAEYNLAHAKVHEKAVKEDRKLLEKRQKDARG